MCAGEHPGMVAGGHHPTYPTLWSHEADNERTILVLPDSHAVIRTSVKSDVNKAIQERAARIWSTASHVHFNYDFRFNSQSTVACYTTEKTIGGRAWPSILFNEPAYEKLFVLWANCTLGLASYWWHANKTQSGRGTITLTSIPGLPVYDFTQLSSKQLADANAMFDEFKRQTLRPVNELTKDSVREALDQSLISKIFRVPSSLLEAGGPFDLFRRKFAAEPTITGGKRPSSREDAGGATSDIG
jgi:hypothetical protein